MTGAICDLLSWPDACSNPEVAWKIAIGYCPDCLGRNLFAWRPCEEGGWHDMCRHYHCATCESDFCWPPGFMTTGRSPWWLPVTIHDEGFPVVRMKRPFTTRYIERYMVWYDRYVDYREGVQPRGERGRFVALGKPPRRVYAPR